MVAAEIENKVDELLLCLEKDIEHIEKNLLYLNDLRSLVIKRDDAALGKLLDSIRDESESHTKHEVKRQSIRKELADYFSCGMEKMTLSMLSAKLPETHKIQISKNREKLKVLVEELKKEYSSTVMLVSECARFNNLLLKSIFNLGKTGAIYYDANGTAKRQNSTTLVNMQF